MPNQPIFNLSTKAPLCIAHRGYSSHFPENTFAAFDAALTTPLYGIELDVQLTRDDVPVIFHDRTLRRVGGGWRFMRFLTLAQADSWDYGGWFDSRFQGQKLPRLEQVLSRYGPQTVLLIEMKPQLGFGNRNRLERLMRKVIALIRKQGLADRTMVLSFDLAVLAYGHGLAPELRFVWNQDKLAHYDSQASFLFAYCLQYKSLNPTLLKQIRAGGHGILTFAVNTASVFNHVMALGVNGILSGNPQWLASILTEDKLGETN